MSKRIKPKFYPTAMSVAGSDSGGGAGIAADLRTFNALGVFGTFAITAVTSQNPAVVRRIDPLEPAAVTAQIDAVMEKISVKYIKTGMLFSAEIVAAVAEAIKKYRFKVVCDPVMVSTSGSRLLKKDAIEAMNEVLAQASWITPNIPEAELLTGKKITSLPEMLDAAGELGERFKNTVLLKGGHLGGERACDVIYRDGKLYTLDAPLLDVPELASHGTGCTLSSALTAMLALDLPWKQAVCGSKAFVYGSLCQCVEIGSGTFAMYPPTEDFISLIKLNEVE